MSEVAKATIKIDLDNSLVIEKLKSLNQYFQKFSNEFKQSVKNSSSGLNDFEKTVKNIQQQTKIHNETQKKAMDTLNTSFSYGNIASQNFLNNLKKISAVLTTIGLGLSFKSFFTATKDLSELATRYNRPMETMSKESNIISALGGNRQQYLAMYDNLQGELDKLRLGQENSLTDIGTRTGLSFSPTDNPMIILDKIRQGFNKGMFGEARLREIERELGISGMGGVERFNRSSDEEYSQAIITANKMAVSTEKAKEQIDNLSKSLEILKNGFITVGGNLAEVLTPVINKFTSLVEKFNALDKTTQKIIVGSAAFMSVFKILSLLASLLDPMHLIVASALFFVSKVPKIVVAIVDAFTWFWHQLLLPFEGIINLFRRKDKKKEKGDWEGIGTREEYEELFGKDDDFIKGTITPTPTSNVSTSNRVDNSRVINYNITNNGVKDAEQVVNLLQQNQSSLINAGTVQ